MLPGRDFWGKNLSREKKKKNVVLSPSIHQIVSLHCVRPHLSKYQNRQVGEREDISERESWECFGARCHSNGRWLSPACVRGEEEQEGKRSGQQEGVEHTIKTERGGDGKG